MPKGVFYFRKGAEIGEKDKVMYERCCCWYCLLRACCGGGMYQTEGQSSLVSLTHCLVLICSLLGLIRFLR